jgi:hypothetical protein
MEKVRALCKRGGANAVTVAIKKPALILKTFK